MAPRVMPAWKRTQNHRLKVAPAKIAAPTTAIMGNTAMPIMGLENPKILAWVDLATLPQLIIGLMSQLGFRDGF